MLLFRFTILKDIVRCLECLAKQTLKDIEVIIVDDGSTDESGEICDIYAGKYDNFKVFHKQNGWGVNC